MKYKIANTSETGKKFLAIRKRMKAAKIAAEKLAKQLGATDVYTSGSNVYGGIDGLGFAKTPDLNIWRHVGKKWQNIFYPKAKSGKEIIAKIANLPLVQLKEINDIVGFKPEFTTGGGGEFLMVHIKSISLQFATDYVLVGIDPRVTTYKPNTDMVEILESEFIELTQPKNKPK